MNTIDVFLIYSILLLLSRLFFIYADKSLPRNIYRIIVIIQVLSLLFIQFSINWLILIILVILLNYIFYYLEQKFEHLNLIRFISLFVFIALYLVFFRDGTGMKLYGVIVDALREIRALTILEIYFSYDNFHKILVIIFGILLASNESNLIIRMIIQHFNTIETDESNEKGVITPKVYDAGRVIGILERILIVIFIAAGQWAAIGFILAAKGFARYQHMDKREFAEYVLIGTLLSALLAIVVGMGVKVLMG